MMMRRRERDLAVPGTDLEFFVIEGFDVDIVP